MKSNLKAAVRILAALCALTTVLHVRGATEIVPLILVDEVPLPDAIQNLARQINLNCIIDPCVPGSYFGDGRKVRAPEVSFRFENRTVEDVLEFVMKKYKLRVITNHATTVARIVPLNHRVRPVPSSPELSDSNGILPTLFLNGVT